MDCRRSWCRSASGNRPTFALRAVRAVISDAVSLDAALGCCAARLRAGLPTSSLATGAGRFPSATVSTHGTGLADGGGPSAGRESDSSLARCATPAALAAGPHRDEPARPYRRCSPDAGRWRSRSASQCCEPLAGRLRRPVRQSACVGAQLWLDASASAAGDHDPHVLLPIAAAAG